MHSRQLILPESTAWYAKTQLTFSDLLNAIRKELESVNLPFLPEFTYEENQDDLNIEERLASAC